jgi:hypothetical protein
MKRLRGKVISLFLYIQWQQISYNQHNDHRINSYREEQCYFYHAIQESLGGRWVIGTHTHCHCWQLGWPYLMTKVTFGAKRRRLASGLQYDNLTIINHDCSLLLLLGGAGSENALPPSFCLVVVAWYGYTRQTWSMLAVEPLDSRHEACSLSQTTQINLRGGFK